MFYWCSCVHVIWPVSIMVPSDEGVCWSLIQMIELMPMTTTLLMIQANKIWRPNKALEDQNKLGGKYYKIGGPIIKKSRHTRPFLPIAAIPQSLDINQGPELKSKSSSSFQSICCSSKIDQILLLILAGEWSWSNWKSQVSSWSSWSNELLSCQQN